MYTTSLDHLKAELGRVEQIVLTALAAWRAANRNTDRDYLGLCITEEEIDVIAGNPDDPQDTGSSPLYNTDARQDLLKSIDKEKAESLRQGIPLRLHTLSQRFGLSRAETDILLLVLLPELDLRYEKIFSYLQNDVTQKRPTVDLAIRLLCTGQKSPGAARALFSPSAPLVKNRLVQFQPRGNEGGAGPLLSRPLATDERVVAYLLGSDEIDERLDGFATLIRPGRTFSGLVDSQGTYANFREKVLSHYGKNVQPMVFLSGDYGTGKRHAAEALSGEVKKNLLAASTRAFLEDKNHELLAVLVREAVLQDNILLFEESGQLAVQDTQADIPWFLSIIDSFPGSVILSSEHPVEIPRVIRDHAKLSFVFPVPSYEDRIGIWNAFLDGGEVPSDDIRRLATLFRISAGQIQDAIAAVKDSAPAGNPVTGALSVNDLISGCKAQSNRTIARFAKPVAARYCWDDIFLKPETRTQLVEICNYIKYKGTVYSDWGFDKKLSLGKGLNILFSGMSGTGKTMAAEIISHETGLDMYKIDLSSIVSKYIGETEKNLNSIFAEAATSNAILFFDEADALFGKRTAIRDAHDRYANIEVNFLLQKMEEYEVIVILASNLTNNIDDAFRRRMHFSVDFALPEQNIRKEIWRNAFPDNTPVVADIDYEFLSGFKMTGGNIKNIVINSAFLAAAGHGRVTMKHIVLAARREFQKMGRLYAKEEFGPYCSLLEE